MALRISEVLPCKEVSIEIDEYVPITVEFASDDLGVSLYWRGGDAKTSLVEIGLSERSREVRRVVLVNVLPENIHLSDDSLSIAKEVLGTPVFDVSRWNTGGDFGDKFLDDFGNELDLFVGKNAVLLILNRNVVPFKTIRNFNIGFNVSSDGWLHSIELNNIEKNKISILCPSQVAGGEEGVESI
jgi:hypothetical protein